MNSETQFVSVNAAQGAQYFEEFVEAYDGGDVRPKGLGVRIVRDAAQRKLGVDGARTFTLTEPIELMKCFKRVTVKASAKKPLKVTTYLYPIGK